MHANEYGLALGWDGVNAPLLPKVLQRETMTVEGMNDND